MTSLPRGNLPKYRYRLAALSLLLATAAAAEPRFARMYKGEYGYTPSCDVCHVDGGGTRLNRYGEDFKQAGSNLAAFMAIADQDSDGDGFPNQEEILAKANPGHNRSTPKQPGDWLSTANLIPRAVQKQFPGVTAYKPLDAILTASELERAEQLGVTLVKEDETTIYIPVKEGRPVGTAIIVPAEHQGETFFILLATDRDLSVTHAGAMHASGVPEARDKDLYAKAIGRSVEDLPAASGDGSLADAVRAGIKKAGTLLHVRLKKG